VSRIASFASAFAFNGFAVGESGGDMSIGDAVVTAVAVADAAVTNVTVADPVLTTVTVGDAAATP
jgi:hypothetical protein